MGTVAEIRAAAAKKGFECHVIPLDSQFRCGGSDAYLGGSYGSSAWSRAAR